MKSEEFASALLFFNYSLLISHPSCQLLGQDALQLLGREAQLEVRMDGDADAARLFADDDGNAVALVGDAQCCSVAQTQFLGDVEAVRDGQDATCSTDALVGNDHRSVVQGRVLEEDVLDELLTDVGVDVLASCHNVVQRCGTLNNDEGAYLLLAHRHTRHHDGHDGRLQLLAALVLVIVVEDAPQGLHALVSAQVVEELADVLLEEDNQSDNTYRDHFVQDAAQQSHLQHLRHHEPQHDEDHDAHEHRQRPRLLHESVDVVHHGGDQHDVDDILQSEFEKHLYFTINNLLSSRTPRPRERRELAILRHLSSAQWC